MEEIRKEAWYVKNKTDLLVYGTSLLYFLFLIVLATLINPVKSNGLLDESFFGIGTIRWYAIFILSGIIVAAITSGYEFKRGNIKIDDLYDGLLIFVPLSIIGARLYYVFYHALFEGGSYSNFLDVINPMSGGMAIHGAIIVTLVGLIFFARWKKINYWFLIDIVTPGFLIGQIMGRWGNFMNHEAYGPVIEQQWVIKLLPDFILRQMSDLGSGYYHPTFLYEGLWNFIGLVIILIIRRKKILKVGDIGALYLMWYGIGRGLLIEPFRQDPLLFFGLKVNVLNSLAGFLVAGLLIFFGKRYFQKDLPYYYDLTNLKNELEEKKEIQEDV